MEKKEAPKLVGITVKKSEDFSEWYNQVVIKAKLADFTSIKGFMAVMPNGYAIWEKIQDYFNSKIKATGHRNMYFPAVIPEGFLKKEKEHLEGFSPEAFWVTHEGPNKLEERLALRPTSETIIYDSYSKWIKSWRDLPLLYNCWNSVFRYETKMTKLFVRTREFLWQEGHTAHATKEEADNEVALATGFYKDLMENLLAIPVLVGKKTEREKFAGALYTIALESLMPDGKVLQMGTSHNLGQNFSLPFNVKFQDRKGQSRHVWTTSWGSSTRMIGALVMVHGDDKGLVLPPRVAPVQAVIVPIIFEKEKHNILKKAEGVRKRLENKFTVHLDSRDTYSPGWKFNEWELLGVPLRIEIGPKDVKKNQAVLVRRDTGEKESIKLNSLESKVASTLEQIQKDMYEKARLYLKKNIREVKTFPEFRKVMEEQRGFIRADWCGNPECEDKIQGDTGATIRVITEENTKGKCVHCGKSAKYLVYFGRSY